MSFSEQAAHHSTQPGPDAPLRLDDAVRLAFPFGGMTVSGLRREAARGRLVVEMIAGKQFTTLRNIEQMREKCREQQKAPDCGLNPKSATRRASSSGGPSWVIRDGKNKVRTGCARADREGAEQALAEYIARSTQVPRDRGRHPSQILVLDVLNIYLIDKAPKHSDPTITKARVMTLAAWWGDKTLADVNGTTCREYVAHRTAQPRRAAKPDVTGNPARMVTAAGARRELEDLRSAINHHRTEGLCSEFVGVALPDKSDPKEDWLTRSEAARLIWAAWRARQKMGEGITDRDVGRHVARFMLVGFYTGTRHGAICSRCAHAGSWSGLCRYGQRRLLPAPPGRSTDEQATAAG